MIFRDLDWANSRIRIVGEYLSNIRFADDIVLFAENLHGLYTILGKLNGVSKKIGLHMNFSKINVRNNKDIEDKGTTIEIEYAVKESGPLHLPRKTNLHEILKRRGNQAKNQSRLVSSTFENKKIPLVYRPMYPPDSQI